METYDIGAAEIFTLFFVMLGPVKIIGAFGRGTAALENLELHKLAWQSALLAFGTLVIGGFFGQQLAEKWHISPPLLMLAAGIVFFLVVLKMLVAPSRPEEGETSPNPAKVTFSMICTPYGMAAVIVLLAFSHSIERTLLVLGLLALVMILNLLSMLYVRSLTKGVGPLMLAMLGAVLGIMQAAMALAIIGTSLRHMNLIANL